MFVACAIPVGAYGVLREDLSSGLFSAAAFVLLSLELTMVGLGTLDMLHAAMTDAGAPDHTPVTSIYLFE